MSEIQGPDNPVGKFKSLRKKISTVFKKNVSEKSPISRQPSATEDKQIPYPTTAKDKEPVRVSDPHRIQSIPPMTAEQYAPVKPLFVVNSIVDSPDWGYINGFSFDLEKGERLIVDGIPYKDFATGKLEAERSLQVYHNQEGFLVANKVVDGQIEKRGELLLGGRNEEGDVEVLGITDKRTGDFAYNYEKQDMPNGDVQLTSTTYKIPWGGGSYSSIEIVIETPDDTGNKVTVILEANAPINLPEPIVFRKVSKNL